MFVVIPSAERWDNSYYSNAFINADIVIVYSAFKTNCIHVTHKNSQSVILCLLFV